MRSCEKVGASAHQRIRHRFEFAGQKANKAFNARIVPDDECRRIGIIYMGNSVPQRLWACLVNAVLKTQLLLLVWLVLLVRGSGAWWGCGAG